MYLERIHDKSLYSMPNQNKAFILYNLVLKEIYDPLIFQKFEESYKTANSNNCEARHCFGGLWAYYKSNQGSRFGIDFWTSKLEDNIAGMHAQEVVQLLEAFRDNRNTERSQMINLLETSFKPVLLKKWRREVMMNQRTLFGLADEFIHIQYYDQELWSKIAETTLQKKKINNTHDFKIIHSSLCFLNEDKEAGFEGQFTEQIEKLVEKHYTVDRKWRYCLEKRDWRTLQELIDRRDECKQTDDVVMREQIDLEILEKAKQAERKLKRLKMAKYSQDLFDEIIEEMMREKKTLMEMMAELDCDEENIYAAQTRIAKR